MFDQASIERALSSQATAMREHADRFRTAHFEPPSVWVDPEGRRVRMYADHVLIVLKPLDEVTGAGVVVVRDRKTVVREPRIARVLAVGPGHYIGCRHCAVTRGFVRTTVRAGEEVLVPHLAGADWSLDRLPPRHMPQGVEWGINEDKHHNYGESQLIGDLRLSTLRVVREEEIIAVLEDG